MAEIKSLTDYNKKLRETLKDKLFFLNHIPDDGNNVFLDFGCADGAILDAIHRRRAHDLYIGYDSNIQMVELASRANPGMKFSTDANSLVKDCMYYQSEGMHLVVILSSVLHELYSQNTKDRMDMFWENMFGIQPEYICIRDMGMGFDELYEAADDEWLKNIQLMADPVQLADFRAKHGAMKYNHHIKEFLLKYRYKNNWKRELDEYYMIDVDHVTQSCTRKGYETIEFEQFNVPWIVNKIKEDFDIDLEEKSSKYGHTHFSMVVKKKENPVFEQICKNRFALPLRLG